ncbi:MAG: GNAT family N-acetyltransferase [bacterium]|nr:GNAT family N-acetyltransferase [bacterium]
MKVRGEWPDPITITERWAKAGARPWNSELPFGYLSLERGSSRFLLEATRHVESYGVELVASPPVLDGSARKWEQVGYRPFLDLHLYRRSLIGWTSPRPEGVQEIEPDYRVLAEVDRMSFRPLWRSTEAGLRASRRATSRGTVLVTGTGDLPEGFAIVGCSGVTSYLQRIAVSPSHRGRGRGRRLIHAALHWAVRHGSASMVLNTPPSNGAAAGLYRSAGFSRLPDRLRVLRYG